MGANTSDLSLASKNDFDFHYIIGRGGFSRVWKVTYKKADCVLSLKEMMKLKIIDTHCVNYIQNEQSILSHLWNPFIVNMLGSFQDDDKLYMAIEYLSGGDLRYHLRRRKRFSQEESKFIIGCIVIAIDYIQSHNIVHRDLKPENLVFDAEGYVKLCDFGFAVNLSKDKGNTFTGTMEYVPPEVVDKSPLTYSVDYYPIGIILYELMFGYRPYHCTSEQELLETKKTKQITLAPCQIPKTWNKEVHSIVNGLLIINPHDRIGQNQSLLTTLQNHPWYQGFDWDALMKREMISPFIPEGDNNFNQAYCEGTELIGTETMLRYQEYINNKTINTLFQSYSYVNPKIRRNHNVSRTHKIVKANDQSAQTIHLQSQQNTHHMSLPIKKKVINFDKSSIIKPIRPMRKQKNLSSGSSTIELPLLGNKEYLKNLKLLKVKYNKNNTLNNTEDIKMCMKEKKKSTQSVRMPSKDILIQNSYRKRIFNVIIKGDSPNLNPKKMVNIKIQPHNKKVIQRTIMDKFPSINQSSLFNYSPNINKPRVLIKKKGSV